VHHASPWDRWPCPSTTALVDVQLPRLVLRSMEQSQDKAKRLVIDDNAENRALAQATLEDLRGHARADRRGRDTGVRRGTARLCSPRYDMCFSAVESVGRAWGSASVDSLRHGSYRSSKAERTPEMRCLHGRARLAEVLPLRACSSLNGTRLLVVLPDTPIHRTSRA
jgi:hypothetical protein